MEWQLFDCLKVMLKIESAKRMKVGVPLCDPRLGGSLAVPIKKFLIRSFRTPASQGWRQRLKKGMQHGSDEITQSQWQFTFSKILSKK